MSAPVNLDQPRARVSDPRTSHDAAASVDLNRSQRLVMEAAYALHLTIGEFINEDLEHMCEPKISPSGARSRREKLATVHGYFEFTGKTRKNSRGKSCQVHRLTAAGLEKIKEMGL